MINPTGGPVRRDPQGAGHYGASRGHRLHKGTDYVCTPGQDVVAPIDGLIKRKVWAYADDFQWVGLEIAGRRASVKLLYVEMSVEIGDWVTAGAVVGKAQDISERYNPEMVPHVHIEITNLDFECLQGV